MARRANAPEAPRGTRNKANYRIFREMFTFFAFSENRAITFNVVAVKFLGDNDGDFFRKYSRETPTIGFSQNSRPFFHRRRVRVVVEGSNR